MNNESVESIRKLLFKIAVLGLAIGCCSTAILGCIVLWHGRALETSRPSFQIRAIFVVNGIAFCAFLLGLFGHLAVTLVFVQRFRISLRSLFLLVFSAAASATLLLSGNETLMILGALVVLSMVFVTLWSIAGYDENESKRIN